MTRAAHTLISLCVGVTAATAISSADGMLLGLGILAGGNLPDDLELPRRPDAFGVQRPPLIPHRTITHWPWTWAAAMMALLLLRSPYATVGAGAMLGALVHLLCDSVSPHGIPFISPFRALAPRTSVYTTRRASELRLVLPCILVAALSVAYGWRMVAPHAALAISTLVAPFYERIHL